MYTVLNASVTSTSSKLEVRCVIRIYLVLLSLKLSLNDITNHRQLPVVFQIDPLVLVFILVYDSIYLVFLSDYGCDVPLRVEMRGQKTKSDDIFFSDAAYLGVNYV